MRPLIFITLTTIAERLPFLDQVLERLIAQTVEANRIILNVSMEPYMADTGIRFEDLPTRTRQWVTSGQVELYFCRNIGPYRKIMPVLDRFGFGDYYLATADDDVFYPPEWLEVLVRVATRHGCVAAYRCRLIEWAGAAMAPYNTWPLLTPQTDLRERLPNSDTPSLRLFPTGRGGVIYHSTYFKDINTLRHLQKLAPAQDDIAFKFVTLLAGVAVARAPSEETSARGSFEFSGSPGGGSNLWSTNSTGRNDKALADVVEWCQRHRSLEFGPQS